MVSAIRATIDQRGSQKQNRQYSREQSIAESVLYANWRTGYCLNGEGVGREGGHEKQEGGLGRWGLELGRDVSAVAQHFGVKLRMWKKPTLSGNIVKGSEDSQLMRNGGSRAHPQAPGEDPGVGCVQVVRKTALERTELSVKSRQYVW